MQTRSAESDAMKRLTIDIPADLHHRLKLMAASQGAIGRIWCEVELRMGYCL
jgi:hypothetical protein